VHSVEAHEEAYAREPDVHTAQSNPQRQTFEDERDPIYISYTGSDEAPISSIDPETADDPLPVEEDEPFSEDLAPDELASLDALETEVEENETDVGYLRQDVEEAPDAE